LGSAIAHLNGILTDHLAPEKQSEPVAVWARQTLARVLSSQPNHQAFQQALGLIEANRVAGQLSQYDKRLKGFLLAQRDEPFYRQQGIRLLETIPDRSLKRRESLALAELYFLSDRWRECKAIMEKLNVQYPEDIDLLSRYCEMLFEVGDKTQARTWLRRLNKVAPNSLPALKLKAYDAKLQGDFALSQFEKSMLDSLTKGGRRPAPWEKVRIGKVLQEAELFDAAENQLREAAKKDKKYQMDLAQFLANRGKFQEAIQLCDEILNKDNVRQICTLMFNAMASRRAEIRPADNQQLHDWIAMAKKEYPEDSKMRMQEAFLLDMQGKTAEAIDHLNGIDWENLSEYEQGMLTNNRAYLNLKLGQNVEEVARDLAIAFENLGPKIELLDTRAMASIEKKQFEQAIRDLSLATEFEPNSGRYHFHLALAYQGRDDRANAKQALELAQAIGLSQKVMEPAEKSKYEMLERWLEN
jgi:tetratricopeptide (TPR) repeat protein